MGYDLGVLSPDLAAHLQDSPLADWPVVDGDILITTRTLQNKVVAVFFFPNPGTEAEWEALQQRILEQAADLKEQADLIIGVSPWGKSREQIFLQHHSGLLDLLLGSGPGGSVNTSAQITKRTLWIRPYSKGKIVNTMFFPDWQNPELDPGQLPPERISTETIVLDDSIEADPEITALIAGSP